MKNLERLSQKAKRSWRRHCNLGGASIYDPNRHDDDFLRRFLAEYDTDPSDPLHPGGQSPARAHVRGPRWQVEQ